MMRFAVRFWLGFTWLLVSPWLAAAPRLDAFPGYSSAGYARLGTHFPLALELQGEGPTVRGHILVTAGSVGSPVRYPVELPAGTTKRIILPLFAASPGGLTLDIQLVNEFGKTVAERRGVGVIVLAPEAVLVGTLPGLAQSSPGFPESPANKANSDLRPLAARMDAGLFPESALALEGLNAIYLSSRRALDLKEPQYAALLAWAAGGGHVIVAVENPTDVTATPWLQDFLPAKVNGVASVPAARIFQEFLKGTTGPGRAELQYGTQPVGLHTRRAAGAVESPFSALPVEPDFERQQVAATVLTPVPEAQAFIGLNASPLAVSGRYGRGLVTVLGFNPEQEPFRSWKHRGWFFARLASVPHELLSNDRLNLWGGHGIDTIFGSMIDTRQIRKLPVGVLLVLLLVYLGVIGPFDQWWLKKINRPMLTWVTFPTYVALFSLLIYFIGFKLRSGQSEYSELQIVDVLPRGHSGEAALRGRSFASLYSPANNTYRLKSELPVATLRGEFRSGFGLNNDAGRLDVSFPGKGFEASAYVPVWTAQGYVADWTADVEAPVSARWAGGRLTVKSGGGKFTKVLVVHGGQLHDLGPLGAEGEVNFTERSGRQLEQIGSSWGARFSVVAARRENTFGNSDKEHINPPDWAEAVIAASFCGRLTVNDSDNQRDWMWSNGFDLTPNQLRGDTIVFAWQGDATATPLMNQFTALRGTKSAMYRLVVPKSAETP